MPAPLVTQESTAQRASGDALRPLVLRIAHACRTSQQTLPSACVMMVLREKTAQVRILHKTDLCNTVEPPIKDPPRKGQSLCKGHSWKYLSLIL